MLFDARTERALGLIGRAENGLAEAAAVEIVAAVETVEPLDPVLKGRRRVISDSRGVVNSEHHARFEEYIDRSPGDTAISGFIVCETWRAVASGCRVLEESTLVEDDIGDLIDDRARFTHEREST